MEEKFSGKVFTYFLQKLNTSWMIIDETLWSRDIKFSQSQLFWFCSSPFYPILSSHDCNPENWASNSTILFLVYKHRTKKFARIFKNITSEALCGNPLLTTMHFSFGIVISLEPIKFVLPKKLRVSIQIHVTKLFVIGHLFSWSKQHLMDRFKTINLWLFYSNHKEWNRSYSNISTDFLNDFHNFG